MGTADPKLAGHMYANPVHVCVTMFLWLPFLWGADCTRLGRKGLFEWGPPVQGNFKLSSPNLVH